MKHKLIASPRKSGSGKSLSSKFNPFEKEVRLNDHQLHGRMERRIARDINRNRQLDEAGQKAAGTWFGRKQHPEIYSSCQTVEGGGGGGRRRGPIEAAVRRCEGSRGPVTWRCAGDTVFKDAAAGQPSGSPLPPCSPIYTYIAEEGTGPYGLSGKQSVAVPGAPYCLAWAHMFPPDHMFSQPPMSIFLPSRYPLTMTRRQSPRFETYTSIRKSSGRSGSRCPIISWEVLETVTGKMINVQAMLWNPFSVCNTIMSAKTTRICRVIAIGYTRNYSGIFSIIDNYLDIIMFVLHV